MSRARDSGQRAEAIFGAFDGLMTSIGLTLGAAHASRHTILTIAVCVSLTGAMSMGAGTLLEDDEHGLRDAAAMGAATLVGTFLPVLPVLLLPGWWAPAGTATVAALMAGLIARARGGRRRDYLMAYAMLVAVAVPTVAVAAAFGAA